MASTNVDVSAGKRFVLDTGAPSWAPVANGVIQFLELGRRVTPLLGGAAVYTAVVANFMHIYARA